MVGTEARVDLKDRQQTANHESCANQQYRGQADFDHDESSAHGTRVSARGLRAPVEDCDDLGARDIERGEDPKEYSRKNAGRGSKQQDRNTDVDLLRSENVCRLERKNGFDSPA